MKILFTKFLFIAAYKNYIYYKYTTKLIGKSKLISKNSGNFKFKNY